MHPRIVDALRAQLRARDPGARRSVVQVALAAGDRVVAEIDGLGRVSAVVAR